MDPKYDEIGDPITKTIEECVELVHILCKVQRFGWNNFHPDDPKKKPNWKRVQDEMFDVERRISVLKVIVKKYEKDAIENGT